MNLPELIKDAKNNNRAAQKCLFDLYAGSMLQTCKRYVKCPEDAEECLLDGFYEFFKNIDSFKFKAEPALLAWLKKIMIHKCLMFIRRTNSFDMVSGDMAANIVIEENVLHKLAAKEITKLIMLLPVGYRTVFNLNEVDGYSHEEIAAMLKISNATSRSQLKKSKTLLQKLLTSKNLVHENYRSNKQ